jgi:hypothetical protein
MNKSIEDLPRINLHGLTFITVSEELFSVILQRGAAVVAIDNISEGRVAKWTGPSGCVFTIAEDKGIPE